MNDVESMNYSVYVHVFPDGKMYIGATRQKPIYRWRRGAGYKNAKTVWSAIQEVGWDNIQHIVLADGLDKDTAMVMEQELIKKYHTQNPEHGYNYKNGGQSFGQHSDEFLENLRKRLTGNQYSAGRKMSESHKKALADANRNRVYPKTFLGHTHTDEAKKVMSEKAQERWNDPGYRRKQHESRPDFSGEKNPRYGKPVSEETRKKISQANKGICRPSREHLERIWKANSKPVVCLDLDGNVIETYPSARIAAIAVNAKPENVGFCCRNHGRTCKGYKWRYKEDMDADRC